MEVLLQHACDEQLLLFINKAWMWASNLQKTYWLAGCAHPVARALVGTNWMTSNLYQGEGSLFDTEYIVVPFGNVMAVVFGG